MPYPTRRAVLLVALGLPISLLAAAAAPGLWLAGVAWVIFAGGIILLDVLVASRGQLRIAPSLPNAIGMGHSQNASFALAFAGSSAPAHADVTLDTGPRLKIFPQRRNVAFEDGKAVAEFALQPLRRGEGQLHKLWVRWTGPLGLGWVQKTEDIGRSIPIIPNVQAVKDEAMRLFRRDAPVGLRLQLHNGDGGSEFYALRDFQSGMDRRTMDWKQSARHGVLLAKEFQAEQNQHIVVALDTGRLMSAPLGGQPRLDRALHAMLLLAYVGLKLGDRIGLFAFDERPRLRSGTVAGAAAFPLLQRLAAKLDYSTAETNFTLGLTQLAGDLEHRSIVVIFTDFSDATSAELMLENVGRLLRRHLVLFVIFRDEELEEMANHEPQMPEDVSRAVIADAMLREREIVVERLRRLGVQIVDAPADKIATSLLKTYFAVKRRDRF
ncbi:MAG TPA: DUF58 domain-containing protein [Rhizomicrobium sp.]|jgi:uncharacterized protein (DUF58 family)